MGPDAMVWLLVGLGLGVALSLLLFIGYATLEGLRLKGRMKKARALRAAEAARAAPRRRELAMPVARERQPAAPVAAPKPATRELVGKPANDPAPRPVEPKPVSRPARAPDAAPVATVAVQAAETAKAAPIAPVETKPGPERIEAVAPQPVKPATRKSVEEMFADAFANARIEPVPAKQPDKD